MKTDQLASPAMLSPHESLLLNRKRGLLGAELGNPAHQRRLSTCTTCTPTAGTRG